MRMCFVACEALFWLLCQTFAFVITNVWMWSPHGEIRFPRFAVGRNSAVAAIENFSQCEGDIPISAHVFILSQKALAKYRRAERRRKYNKRKFKNCLDIGLYTLGGAQA